MVVVRCGRCDSGHSSAANPLVRCDGISDRGTCKAAFHVECLGIETEPPEPWACPQCKHDEENGRWRGGITFPKKRIRIGPCFQAEIPDFQATSPPKAHSPKTPEPTHFRVKRLLPPMSTLEPTHIIQYKRPLPEPTKVRVKRSLSMSGHIHQKSNVDDVFRVQKVFTSRKIKNDKSIRNEKLLSRMCDLEVRQGYWKDDILHNGKVSKCVSTSDSDGDFERNCHYISRKERREKLLA